MATAVKMDEAVKEKIEEIQAEIRLETGRKVTQQEILERMVENVDRSRTEFVDSFRDSTVPLSDEQKEKLRESQFDSGVETDEDDIDDILYG
ncbi:MULTISPECIES: hypothetical protein [Halomicrobium]|uniref:Uncharacterized protein n=1 Tax=Halomicrobium mukohataei TaxID=57705 RepID=A0A847UEC6_9EURY|nr:MULTISPECIES: hypothetical protein [Halomicrobium]MBO4248838.1 hypothetical protein [Halomicrobium sp. IBSBa]NLV09764.1 hypothetical protein [Halomicrobium mukohataei]QGA82032.1 RHH family protein, predicted antitoxin of TA system [Halomicrobium sp. LC1Hm]